MPIVTTSKMQGSVKTLTYRSEFAGLKSGIEEVLAVCAMICEMGFTLMTSCILCNNTGIVTASTNVLGLLKKRSTSLAYNMTRENLAAQVIELQYIMSGQNVANILTKVLQGDFFTTLSRQLVVGYRVRG